MEPHPVYADFNVRNPETGNVYQVAIRSRDDSANYCSCLDYKTNRLGVCKHIGFLLHKLENKRGYKKFLKEGYRQAHSTIFLEYREGRKVRLSIGTAQKELFEKFAKKHFDDRLLIKQEGFPIFEKILEEPRAIHDGFHCYDDALVQTGVSFLSGMAKTLSDPAETQKLVGSLTARYEVTGQTYLKIPVENEARVANAIQVLGGLFWAFGKN